MTKGTQGFKRSLPDDDVLQENPQLAKFLREVLVIGRSEDDLESNEYLDSCYKKGWLQAELVGKKTVYVFPTVIHQRYEFPVLITATIN